VKPLVENGSMLLPYCKSPLNWQANFYANY